MHLGLLLLFLHLPLLKEELFPANERRIKATLNALTNLVSIVDFRDEKLEQDCSLGKEMKNFGVLTR